MQSHERYKLPVSRPILWLATFCFLLASSARAQNTRMSVPSSPPSPQSMQECSQLASEWDQLSSRLETEHQNCLDAHSREQANPNASSGPGTQCSYGACQSLHTERYEVQQQGQAQIQQCQDQVNQFQQEQAASEQAEQQAQQQMQQEVSDFRSEGQTLAQQDLNNLAQQQTQEQNASQALQAQEAAQEASRQQTADQMKALAQSSVDQLKAQAGKDKDSDSMSADPSSGPPSQSDLSQSLNPPAPQPNSSQSSDATQQINSSQDLASLLEKRDRYGKGISDIEAAQQQELQNNSQGVSDSQKGMFYGFLQMLKGGSDAFVDVAGEVVPGEGKAIKSIYDSTTSTIGVISSATSDGGAQDGLGAKATETGFSVLGTGALIKLGEDAPVVNGLGAIEHSVGAYNGAGESGLLQPLIVTSQAGNALTDATEFVTKMTGGGTVTMGGAEIDVGKFAGGAGKVFGAATGAMQGMQLIGQGASNFSDSYNMIDTIQNRHQNFVNTSNAQLQRLRSLQDAVNQQIYQALTQQIPTTSTPSAADSSADPDGGSVPVILP
jgi:hypothetical protein